MFLEVFISYFIYPTTEASCQYYANFLAKQLNTRPALVKLVDDSCMVSFRQKDIERAQQQHHIKPKKPTPKPKLKELLWQRSSHV